MASVDFQLVRPDPAAIGAGVRHLVGNSDSAFDAFVAYAQTAKIDLSRQVIAVTADGTVLAVCLWVASPGKTAILFVSPMSGVPQFVPALTAAVEGALADAKAAGIVLMQALFETTDQVLRDLYASVGLWNLATLSYMERHPPSAPPIVSLPAGVTLESYSARTHDLLKRSILASYMETRDCPALANLRHVDDVIAGHKAVGPFEEPWWSIVLDDGEPIGCMLLSEIPQRGSLELVYLGLAPKGRGRGIGKSLLLRFMGIASRRHFSLMTLAVDAANAPALKLYRRCGFIRVADRAAMVKKL